MGSMRQVQTALRRAQSKEPAGRLAAAQAQVPAVAVVAAAQVVAVLVPAAAALRAVRLLRGRAGPAAQRLRAGAPRRARSPVAADEHLPVPVCPACLRLRRGLWNERRARVALRCPALQLPQARTPAVPPALDWLLPAALVAAVQAQLPMPVEGQSLVRTAPAVVRVRSPAQRRVLVVAALPAALVVAASLRAARLHAPAVRRPLVAVPLLAPIRELVPMPVPERPQLPAPAPWRALAPTPRHWPAWRARPRAWSLPPPSRRAPARTPVRPV